MKQRENIKIFQEFKTKIFFWLVFFFLLSFFISNKAQAAYTFSRAGNEGLGDANNTFIGALEEFNGSLYACTANGNGLEIYRSSNGLDWTRVHQGGFGNVENDSCASMVVYNNRLYVTTRKEVNPGEVWRTANGTVWSQLGTDGFGDVENKNMGQLSVFENNLYVATINTTNGLQVWQVQSDDTLTKVVDNGFGDASENQPHQFQVFNSYLYLAAISGTGGRLHRTNNGTVWNQINADGFGDGNNTAVESLAVFKGYLYAGTYNVNGGELWRSATGENQASFSQIGGVGGAHLDGFNNQLVRNNLLLVAGRNGVGGSGVEVYSSKDGTSFTLQNTPGFNDLFSDPDPTVNNAVIASANFNNLSFLSLSSTARSGTLLYPELAPTISNITAVERQDGTGYVDLSFDVVTEDNAADAAARVEFNTGSGFTKAAINTVDANTATNNGGDPKVNNSNDNQIGNSSGYITTANGINRVTTIWNSKDFGNAQNIETDSAQIRVRGFSGSAGAYVVSGNFTIDNKPPAAPTLNVHDASTTNSRITLSGGKDANSTIYSSGVLFTSFNALTAWQGDVTLALGINNLSFTSKDGYQNESSAVTTQITREELRPNMVVTKTIQAASGASSGGEIPPGDVLIYTVSYENRGSAAANNFYLYDLLSKYVTYLPGSIVHNGRNITDAKDNDEGYFDRAFPERIFLDIGPVRPGAKGGFFFHVRVLSNARAGDMVENKSTGAYNPGNTTVESNKVTNKVKARGAIGGKVFNDLNRNAGLDLLEGGLKNVTVKVYEDKNRDGALDAGDHLSYVGRTDNNGNFEVKGMSADFYLVEVDENTLPSNYYSTTANNPGRVVLKTSLESFRNANFGYARQGIVGGVVSVIARPTAIIPLLTPAVLVEPKPEVKPEPTREEPKEEAKEEEIIPEQEETPAETSEEKVDEEKQPTATQVEVKKTETAKLTLKERVAKSLPFLGRVWDNRTAQTGLKAVLAPLLVIFTLSNFLLSISLLETLLPYLKYLAQFFTEPLRYFGARGRRSFGTVYNTLTGEPLDLAIVRLYDHETNKLLESYVTDARGRYYFLAEQNRDYHLTVDRSGFVFPSALHAKADEKHGYLGGKVLPLGEEKKKTIESAKGVIAVDIPIDPAPNKLFLDDRYRQSIETSINSTRDLEIITKEDLDQENRKLLRRNTLRKLSLIFSFLGPVLSLVSLILSPGALMLGLFIAHLILFLLFWKLAARKSAKPWGEVFDLEEKNTLGQTIIRLFEPRFGRMLLAKVTNADGRYGFLAGHGNFYLIPSKNGYVLPEKKAEIKSEGGLIKKDLGLKRTS